MSALAQSLHVNTTEGVLVADVSPGSLAAQAGLTRGDVIVTFIGPALIDQCNELLQRLPPVIHQLQHALLQYPWGQYVLHHLTVSRGGLSPSVNLFSSITGLASTAFNLLTNLVLILSVECKRLPADHGPCARAQPAGSGAVCHARLGAWWQTPG